MAGAALETSLTLEEADRMLSALAAKGHLEVTVEHGRLLYSLWEGDAPLYRVSDLANAPVWR